MTELKQHQPRLRTYLLEHCNTPLLFKNKLSWPCRFWKLQEWADKCEDLQFTFQKINGKLNHWETKREEVYATLEDFISFLNLHDQISNGAFESSSEISYYCSYQRMGQIFKGYDSILNTVDWSFVGFDDVNVGDSTFWLGTPGAFTPCHMDTYSVNVVAQIIGRKRWLLFPPDNEAFLYSTRIPYEESSTFSQIDFRQRINLDRFPKFASATPYEVILNPGDVLFVPKHWWHFVICEETALSINTWRPVVSDCEDRVREAVVGILASNLIPGFEPPDLEWVNPNQELATNEDALELLQNALSALQCEQKEVSSSSGNSKEFTSEEIASLRELCGFEDVSPIAVSELTQLSSGASNPAPKRQRVNETEDIIRAFLAPNVIDAVYQNLRTSITSRGRPT